MAKTKKKTKITLARKSKEPFLNGRNDSNYKSLFDTKVAALMYKISAPVSTSVEQSAALKSVRLMLSDTKLRYILLKEGLIKKVLKNSLVNDSQDVLTEAYGLLNIAVKEEGYDVCIYLWRQDIITIIQSHLERIYAYYTELIEPKTKPEKSLSSFFYGDDYSENILSLIIQLANTSEEIFADISGNINVLPDFVNFLLLYSLGDLTDSGALYRQGSLRTTQTLFITLCKMQFIFTEVDPKFISAIRGFPIDEVLSYPINIIPSASQIYLNGLKYNLAVEESIGGCELDQTVMIKILKSLFNVINRIDLMSLSHTEVSSYINADSGIPSGYICDSVGGHEYIKSIQVAIELIAAISETCSIQISNVSDSGAETEEDLDYFNIHAENMGRELTDEMIVQKVLETHVIEDEFESSEELENYNDDSLIRRTGEKKKEKSYCSISREERKTSFSEQNSICEKDQLDIFCPVNDKNVVEGDLKEESPDFDQDTNIVRQYLQETILPMLLNLLNCPVLVSRSLAALSNISWMFALQEPYAKSWVISSLCLWPKVYPYLLIENQDIDILCSTLGILGAICKSCVGDVPININMVSFIIHQALELSNQLYIDDNSFINYMARVINFFTPLAMKEGNSEITEMIGNFFLDLIGLLPKIPAEIVAEVLDSMFKIFADVKYDYNLKVYVGNHYNKKLSDLLPRVKQMGKRIDKRHNLPLRMHSDEAALNLARFIAYKAKENKGSILKN